MKFTMYIKCSGDTKKCKCPKCEAYREYFDGWEVYDYNNSSIYRNSYYGKPETKSRYNKRKRGERPIFLGKR